MYAPVSKLHWDDWSTTFQSSSASFFKATLYFFHGASTGLQLPLEVFVNFLEAYCPGFRLQFQPVADRPSQSIEQAFWKQEAFFIADFLNGYLHGLCSSVIVILTHGWVAANRF
jgi:hypothetical protein